MFHHSILLNHSHRITSYNVCYTKLLRIVLVQEGSLVTAFEGLMEITGEPAGVRAQRQGSCLETGSDHGTLFDFGEFHGDKTGDVENKKPRVQVEGDRGLGEGGIGNRQRLEALQALLVAYRITSYNVCYTKLLRPGSNVLPCASITRVSGPCQDSASAPFPTKTIRFPLTATASA